MALRDLWEDKNNRIDVADAEDLNDVAHAVIENETKIENIEGLTEEIDGKVEELDAAVSVKANRADVYTKSEVDEAFYTRDEVDGLVDGLAPISYTNAKFDMLDKEIENVTYWGGTADYDVNLAQPEHLAGEYRYVPSDVALNGVKVTDTASNIFVFEGQYMCEISTNFREQLPSVCKRVDGGYWYVGLYDSSGKYVGELCGNPDFLPPMWPMSDLGIESKDDTVTVHFGAYGDGGFPSKIEIAPAGSMIFWNGSRWCAVSSAAAVGDIESALDSILAIQSDLIGV